jgi:hypothetical protein
MATEINKNKKWSNPDDVKKRRKKNINETTISNIKSIMNLFIGAIKTKHT